MLSNCTCSRIVTSPYYGMKILVAAASDRANKVFDLFRPISYRVVLKSEHGICGSFVLLWFPKCILEKRFHYRASESFLIFLEFSKTKKEVGDRKNNRPINLLKVITFSTDYKYAT